MQVCKNCGAELHGGKFFPECGTPIEESFKQILNKEPVIEHPIKI